MVLLLGAMQKTIRYWSCRGSQIEFMQEAPGTGTVNENSNSNSSQTNVSSIEVSQPDLAASVLLVACAADYGQSFCDCAVISQTLASMKAHFHDCHCPQ